jgi:hypothetical protein
MTSSEGVIAPTADEAQLLEQWKRWLDGINDDIYRLHIDRYYWRELSEMVQRNPAIPSPGYIMRWFLRLYLNNVAIGIRRQAERRDDVVTLGRLLHSIRSNPTAASRRHFVSLYQSDMLEQRIAQLDFDQFTDPGGEYVAVRIVDADIARLEDETARVVEFASKQVAHLDPRYAYPEGVQPTDYPSLDELDAALDVIGDLLKKYYLLVTANCMLSPEPILQFNWQQAFSVPWCPPDDDM